MGIRVGIILVFCCEQYDIFLTNHLGVGKVVDLKCTIQMRALAFDCWFTLLVNQQGISCYFVWHLYLPDMRELLHHSPTHSKGTCSSGWSGS